MQASLTRVAEWPSDPSDQVTEWLSDWVTEWLIDQVTEWQDASQTIDRKVYSYCKMPTWVLQFSYTKLSIGNSWTRRL